jgi:hypothetical protein
MTIALQIAGECAPGPRYLAMKQWFDFQSLCMNMEE